MTLPPYYSVEVLDTLGNKITTIDNPISLNAARSYGTTGNATLTILPDFAETFFPFNTRFKLWRTGENYLPTLFGDTVWFLRKFRNAVSQGQYILEIADAMSLLNNPVVAYTARTPYADKTLEEYALTAYTDDFRIDNLMKEYVRENFSSEALDTTRNNPYIVVEQNLNLAPHGEKTAAWAKLDSVLNDLANMSAEKGMELYYDLIPQSEGKFLFRVWKEKRGIDRGFDSADSVVFSDENNDLEDIEVVYDYSNMGTYCYVLGYDSGPSQMIEEVGNAAIVRADPFGRVEFTHNESDSDVEAILEASGQAAIYGRRPRRLLSARLSAGSALRYDIDFSYGDKVGVLVQGNRYDCQISAVNAQWAGGSETLDIRLDGSESLWNPTWWEGHTPTPIIVPPVPGDTPFVPPMPGDPAYYYGDVNGYILWDAAHVFRTWDLQAASPVWELVDTGITGTVLDGQYVHVSAETVGMWLLTTDAIWWCADIMATTPSWSSVLSLATVQAADAVPLDGAVEFKTMFHLFAEPGYLVVATGPVEDETANLSYLHAYYWHTHDYGQTWTQVDTDAFTYDDGTNERCYFGASVYGLDMFRSDDDIWCARWTPRFGLNGSSAVFYSGDGGHTWEKRYTMQFSDSISILAPFPDADDPIYMIRGSNALGLQPKLYVSTDGMVTATEQPLPTGYLGISSVWRANKRTFVPEHVMAWMRHEANVEDHLMESLDSGATWSMIYDSNTQPGRHNTPNGWPPDINVWITVRTNATFSVTNGVIFYTDDKFATVHSKQGNLSSLVASWAGGSCNGFALPKVGVNA